MKRTALITGISGFVGGHLAELLAEDGWSIHGTIRSFRSDMKNLKTFLAAGHRLSTHDCDITDANAVADAVASVRPDAIFHLAAQSYVPDSWSNPQQTLTVNALGTLNVLESVRRHAPDAVVQVASTSEVYGMVRADECPIDEDNALRPLSPYGVSKCAADLLARQYAASYGVKAIVTRAFNHSGPRRNQVFAESAWARQVAVAELAGSGEVAHGNLDAVRDYTDVRDIVRGYAMAAERGKIGEAYVLASGRGLRMGDVLDELIGLSEARITKRADSRLARPADAPRTVGDAARAGKVLGWRPAISTRKMLSDLLDYWRLEVRAGACEASAVART